MIYPSDVIVPQVPSLTHETGTLNEPKNQPEPLLNINNISVAIWNIGNGFMVSFDGPMVPYNASKIYYAKTIVEAMEIVVNKYGKEAMGLEQKTYSEPEYPTTPQTSR